jgi:hypothetical protein
MKTLCFLLFILLFIWPLSANAGDATYNRSGSILYSNGNTLNFERIFTLKGLEPHFIGGPIIVQYKGTKRKIMPDEIDQITFLGFGKYEPQLGCGAYYEAELNVKFTSGTEANVILGDWIYRCFDVEHLEELTKSVKRSPITIGENRNNANVLVRSIVFARDSGKFRYNPRTNTYFPESFIYDPYTGEKLMWKDIAP